MSFLKKVKGFFFGEDAQKVIEEKEEVLEESEEVAQEEHIAPNDNGELIGVCPICNLNMYSEHKITSISGNKLHRACFKQQKKQRRAEMGL